MIVNKEESGEWGRVVLQKDHTQLAWSLAKGFGNHNFASLEPKELMEFLVLNHDRGWDEIDNKIGKDETTGLPYNLVKTPMNQLLASGPESVAFNEAKHPYCGLLASMHVWGLFNGRYGLSDKLVVDLLQGDDRIAADQMLTSELKRQEQLKEQLIVMPGWEQYIKESSLMSSYKQLQFFDTLSLHLNNEDFDRPTSAVFVNVPKTKEKDCDVSLEPLGDNSYRMSPYPFEGHKIEVRLPVYRIPVMAGEVDYRQVFLESKPKSETITILE